jgi:uncharacterized membrane protein YgaE (UPF0421/DUF939 family)
MSEGMSEAPNRFTARGEAVLEEVARRSRITLAARFKRLRRAVLPIIQMGLAAAGAWWIARELIGHPAPFFAPIAAVISLGVSFGQRLRRAVELVIGVAVGILAADALVALIGTGTLQLAFVVVLAVAAALFIGGGPLLVNQAAASAVLVVVLTPPHPGEWLTLTRFIDALVGGLVGLLINVVLLPVNPLTVARRHVNPLLNELAAILDHLAQSLAKRDQRAAEAVLNRARGTGARVAALHEGLEGSDEVARLAPVRWRVRSALAEYLAAAEPLDVAVRSARVVARNAVAVLRNNDSVPASFPGAVDGLAAAVRLLRKELAEEKDPVETRRMVASAARAINDGLAETSGVYVDAFAVSLRSLAVDLLMATGMDRDTAIQAMPELPETG